MLLPVKWLKEYVEIDEDSRSLADKLTSTGSHVEAIISLDRGIENVVVGRVENIRQHDGADRLLIIDVDVGQEVVQVITGATNLVEGDHVPVALVGAKLPGDIYIEKSSFRGVDSHGMLCSLKELGYGDNVIPREQREGIFVLHREYELGTDINDILELYGEVIELEITPNRPDCLSIVGMARETAATLNQRLRLPKIELSNEVDDIGSFIESIEIDYELCNRYYTRVIKDVSIEESPLWLQARLMEAGVRPVNNIVDITNYVMLEFGQPLHAFDLDKLKQKKIVVRKAQDGEKIVTLDGVERALNPSNLIITDGEEPTAIAGVMGGLDSEITDRTETVLLESANFNGRSVRLTSKEHNLRSEASSRFEKGLDLNLCEVAAERVCQLVEQIGAGKIVKGVIDVHGDIPGEKEIALRPERANALLGTDLTVDEMMGYLRRLELESTLSNGKLEVRIPTYRSDLGIEEDLVEEIGRIHGFHNIPVEPLVGTLTRGEKPYEKIVEDRAGEILRGLGINQVMTYSFISPKAYDKIRIKSDSELRDYIELINPLGEDYSVMRTTLIPNILDLLSRNYNHGIKECYAYEIGNIFIPKELPIEQLPIERKTLIMGMYGDVDFYDIKEMLEILIDRLGIKRFRYVEESNNPTFHPNRTANLILGNEEVGTIGEIHGDVTDNYDIDRRVYIAQINFDRIVEESDLDRRYIPLPRYPGITRDIAVVVDEDILVGELEEIIWQKGQGLIERVELFDVYTGNQVEEGKKSIAFSIFYRSRDRTLTDEEVNMIQRSIVVDLEEQLNAVLRG
ncbi:MAG: phenylalanine--tRNA ligase subunit beta [Tissierellia bacterium]|nr:phenylalanine--tRNA ligase subunit beta [Tissierellia bacterium]